MTYPGKQLLETVMFLILLPLMIAFGILGGVVYALYVLMVAAHLLTMSCKDKLCTNFSGR